MPADLTSTGAVLDRLEETADQRDSVSLGNVMDALGTRSYGPFLMVPALLELSPVGAIPGVPTALAFIIAVFAVQMVIGRDHFWIPGFLEHRSVSGKRLKQAADTLRPVARRLDSWFYGRLKWLTARPFIRAAALICILLCFTVPPLELVPFASSGPMAAIALFGLALLVRDGALMIAALVVAVAGAGAGLYFVLTGN